MAKDQSKPEHGLASDSPEARATRKRKLEHIEICLEEDVQYTQSTLLEDVSFIHNAVPEISKDDIDLTIDFIGLEAAAPIVIAAMTGGHPKTYTINKRLADAAETLGLPIGVGSQRAALENPSLEDTFRVVRETAPSVPVIANIGATHVREAPDAVSMIDADLLAIHLNTLQEAIQPEGDCDSRGVLASIREIVDAVEVPVIVKETGAGISADAARSLQESGVAAIDVGGAGGTSWSAVEYHRAFREGDSMKAHLGEEFWDWGIPTALSLIMALEGTEIPVMATGGIRSGLDVAKCVSLGAIAAGLAHPLLYSAARGTAHDLVEQLERMIESTRVSMYLIGAQTIEQLRECRVILGGRLFELLKALGLDYRSYMRIY